MNIPKRLKKTLCMVCLLLVGTVSYVSAATGHINITSNIQEQDQWCWAATSKTIISWLNSVSPIPTQSDIVKKVKGSVINAPSNLYEDVESLTAFNITNTYTRSYISFSSVKSYIDSSSPIKTSIAWTNGGGHSHVMYGYYEDGATQNVHFMDPWGDNPRFNKVAYNYYKSNSQYYWQWTVYGNRKA